MTFDQITSSYIALNAAGIQGDIYGTVNQSVYNSQAAQQRDLSQINNVIGNFGQSWMAYDRNTSCSLTPYDENQRKRINNGYPSYGYTSMITGV